MSITIESVISIIPDDNMVSVDGEILHFEISHPETIKGIPWEKIHAFYWNDAEINKIGWYADVLYGKDYKETPLEDSDFETVIKPFADQWQAEKDRLEQEEQEYQEQRNAIQNVRSRAVKYVNRTWDNVEETASVESSLGYTIGVSEKDIKFYTARIETMEDTETVTFKDYHNIERTGVTKANFVTMRKEAYTEYLNLLNIKSEYEANIEQCSTKEQVISLISQLNVFNPSLAPVTDI